MQAQIKQWARDGAKKRLTELKAEMDQIARVFPELIAPPKPRGGRKAGFRMSEESKAKIAAAAKKRWAERRDKLSSGKRARQTKKA